MEAFSVRHKESFGSSRQFVYVGLAVIAVAAMAYTATGRLPVLTCLGLLAGLAFVGLFFTNIKIFLLVYISVRVLLEYFLEPTKVTVGGAASFQMIGMLGVVILAGGFAYLIINRVHIYEVSVVGPMIIFLVATFPTMLFFSMDKVAGFKDWVGTASAFMLFLLIASVFSTRNDIKLLLKALVISSIPPLIVGFYQLLSGTGLNDYVGFQRIYATFAHPNAYALYLAMMLCLMIPLSIETKKRNLKIFYSVIAAALAISLVFTLARAPWFSMLFALLILAVIRYRKMLLILPVAILLIPVFVPTVLDRLVESLSFFNGTGSMFFRIEMWKYLLPRFFSNPIVGNGLGSFGYYAEQGLGRFYLPHNDYIRLLVDTGIIGLGAYIAMIYGVLKGAIKAYMTHTDNLYRVMSLALIAVMAVYIMGGLTENIFRAGTTQTYFWALAGLVFASVRVASVGSESRMRSAGFYFFPGQEPETG